MVRSILSRLLLAAVGLFVAFVIVEGGLRIADVAPQRELRPFWFRQVEPHEMFGWFHVPNAGFQYSTPFVQFQTPVKINSHGLREHEYLYEKRPEVYRLLVIGDSFTASLEVPFSLAWHEILEERLNANGEKPRNKAEIIAAAVQAWGTDQQLLYYQHEGYKYEPDTVVLQFFQNDVFDNDPNVGRLTQTTGLAGKPRFVLDGERLELKDFPYRGEGLPEESERASTTSGRIRVELRKRSHVYRLVRNTMRARRPRGVPFCYRSAREFPYELTTYAPTYPQEFAAAWKLTTRLIRELNTEVAKRGQRFAVVHAPDRRQVLPDAWQATLDCWPAAKTVKWDLDKPNRLLGEFLHTEGIPYLDLTLPLREHSARTGRSTYWELDGHFNPEGHQVVSTIVQEWLVRERLVPSR